MPFLGQSLLISTTALNDNILKYLHWINSLSPLAPNVHLENLNDRERQNWQKIEAAAELIENYVDNAWSLKKPKND